jgi:hypothetical protein
MASETHGFVCPFLARATLEVHETIPQGSQRNTMPLYKAENQAQLDLFATYQGNYAFKVIVTE